MLEFKRKTGLTFLEILITLVIFSVGVISVIKAFNTALFSSRETEYIDTALNIAQAKLEEIKNTSFAGLSDSGPAADSDFSEFSVTVDIAEGDDPMRVDVVVSWNTKGGAANITLTTLVSDY
ncbi:MAG: hypothetical protein ABH872_01700 [Candidatus Omnitrophota bacterium]